MENTKFERESLDNYFEEKEYIANSYVMRCYTISMLVYTRDYEIKSVNSFTTRYSMIIIKAGGSTICFQPYLYY